MLLVFMLQSISGSVLLLLPASIRDEKQKRRTLYRAQLEGNRHALGTPHLCGRADKRLDVQLSRLAKGCRINAAFRA
jgi:hypothetical protein